MPDKGKASRGAAGNQVRKKTSLSPEQRSRRIQQIMFGFLAIIMVLSLIISLIAR